MQIHHSGDCPAKSEPASLALDRERLQSLIDLLARYDFDSEESGTGDLKAALRAFAGLHN